MRQFHAAHSCCAANITLSQIMSTNKNTFESKIILETKRTKEEVNASNVVQENAFS